MPQPVNVLLQSFIWAARDYFLYLLLFTFLLQILRCQLLLVTLFFLGRFGFLQLHGSKVVLDIFVFRSFD